MKKGYIPDGGEKGLDAANQGKAAATVGGHLEGSCGEG